MTQTIRKIRYQTGLSDFKQLIEKWEALSEHIRTRRSKAPIILPDLLFVSGAGTGKTLCLQLLAEYLSEKGNLMDFYGDVKYFEFLLRAASDIDHIRWNAYMRTEGYVFGTGYNGTERKMYRVHHNLTKTDDLTVADCIKDI